MLAHKTLACIVWLAKVYLVSLGKACHWCQLAARNSLISDKSFGVSPLMLYVRRPRLGFASVIRERSLQILCPRRVLAKSTKTQR